MTISKNMRIAALILLAIYLVFLIYFLFDSGGERMALTQGYRYNLIPFREIFRFSHFWRNVGLGSAIMNLLGNVIGFAPYGLLLAVIFEKMRHAVKILLAGALFSLCLESMQLVMMRGIFDVDDIILNSFGTVLGYMVFRIGIRIRRHKLYGKEI